MKCQRRGTNFKIMERLKRYAAITAELVAAGWPRDTASAEAVKRMRDQRTVTKSPSFPASPPGRRKDRP